MSVSVVICAKNAKPTLDRCPESVEKNKPSEIILVDDGSTDSTTEIARRYTDKIYPNEGRGFHMLAKELEKAGKVIAVYDADKLEEVLKGSELKPQEFVKDKRLVNALTKYIAEFEHN